MGLISLPIESLGIFFFKVYPAREPDPAIWHLWTALCKQQDLVSFPPSNSPWSFQRGTKSFYSESKQDKSISTFFFTVSPSLPFQNLQLKICEMNKQILIHLLCTKVARSQKKENHLKISRASEYIFDQKNSFKGTPLTYIYRFLYIHIYWTIFKTQRPLTVHLAIQVKDEETQNINVNIVLQN